MGKGKKEGKKTLISTLGYHTEKVLRVKPTLEDEGREVVTEIVPAIFTRLERSINPLGKRVLQGNCCKMNSQLVVESLFDNGVQRFKIPAPSPDIKFYLWPAGREGKPN